MNAIELTTMIWVTLVLVAIVGIAGIVMWVLMPEHWEDY